MNPAHSGRPTSEQAAALLGVSCSAGDEEIRQAYVHQVRQHPPDREPELFERIRDAYEQLRDPARRARQVLEGPSPSLPLPSLLDGFQSTRRFIGSAPWLNVLKEHRS